ncbi:hypothetical protein BV22DRAFT_1135644 [Leucogyrophana mollusca]|uniref:Uncharacterized protein n=1 Tax=Leucogyrophana mollusca TaxID=85980 RepID=A0ACB8AUQ3_9AGAM|nr:hypothetical protein BV22DRAFT_1135644 [Leucogyrophana mollusca]
MSSQSQPPAQPQRMTTRAKNAHQHPGLVDKEPVAKRRTKAEMEADRKAKEAATQAKEVATQAKADTMAVVHKRIAELEGQLAVKQANEQVDAPKPRQPQPHPKKAPGTKAVGGEDTARGSGKKGKGGEGDETKPTGSASNIGNVPASKDVVAPAPVKGKKVMKTSVRDAISAVNTPATAISDNNGMPRDGNGNLTQTTSAKFDLSGRVKDWASVVSATGLKPNSKHSRTPSSTSLPSALSAVSSTLSKGTTTSSVRGCYPFRVTAHIFIHTYYK